LNLIQQKQNSRAANATKPIDPADFSKSGAEPGYQRPKHKATTMHNKATKPIDRFTPIIEPLTVGSGVNPVH